MGMSGTSSLLWLHGDPGAGKSTIAAYMSRMLPISVAYFFFDDKDERLRTAPAALKTLLIQILIRYPRSHKHFLKEKIYELNKKRTVWSDGMLWRVFERIAADESLGAICLILDAMGRHDIF